MRRFFSGNRAFTIIELIVYQTILLLLLGCIYLVVSSGVRYLQLLDVYQSVIQQAQVGVAGLVREASNSSRSAYAFAAVPTQHVTFADPTPPAGAWVYAGQNVQYWKWICYYYRGASQELVRCEFDPGAPFVVSPPPVIPNFAVALQPLPYRVVARGVQSVQFSPGAANGVLEIRLTTSRETRSDRLTRVSLHTKVRIQNP